MCTSTKQFFIGSLRELKSHLKPAGWVQLTEYYLNIQSNNGSLTPSSAIRRWWDTYAVAMSRASRHPRKGGELSQQLTETGYKHVSGCTLYLPIGGWRPGKFCDPRESIGTGHTVSSLDFTGGRSSLTFEQNQTWPELEEEAWKW